jgi:hypothetical protein
MPVDDFLRGDDRYLGTGIIVPAHVESAEFFFLQVFRDILHTLICK